MRATGRVSMRGSEWRICRMLGGTGIWKVGGEIVET